MTNPAGAELGGGCRDLWAFNSPGVRLVLSNLLESDKEGNFTTISNKLNCDHKQMIPS